MLYRCADLGLGFIRPPRPVYQLVQFVVPGLRAPKRRPSDSGARACSASARSRIPEQLPHHRVVGESISAARTQRSWPSHHDGCAYRGTRRVRSLRAGFRRQAGAVRRNATAAMTAGRSCVDDERLSLEGDLGTIPSTDPTGGPAESGTIATRWDERSYPEGVPRTKRRGRHLDWTSHGHT